MPGLPTGTITFLFTDIEGSTTLLQRLGDRQYAKVLEEHRRISVTRSPRGTATKSTPKEMRSSWPSPGPGMRLGPRWSRNGL